MLKKVIIPLVSVTGLAFLSGCTTQPTTYPNYTATPVAQSSSTLVYKQKADTERVNKSCYRTSQVMVGMFFLSKTLNHHTSFTFVSS